MSEEMRGKWVGPMPVQQFIDSFFDFTCYDPGACVTKWKTYFESLGTFSDSSEMCNGIRDLIARSEAIPGMNVSRAWEESNEKGISQSRTTLALFSEEDIARATTSQSQLESMQLCITTKLTKQQLKEDQRPKDIQHKEYCNRSLGLEEGKTACPRCRDELVSHAKTLFNYQQRTHVFVIHMADPCARLIRFDRDGAIISASFNYRDRGDLLLEFLWTFSNSNEETKGRDPTAIRATAAESALAKEKLARWIPKENHERPVYKLLIQDQELGGTSQRKKMEVLAWAPVSRPSSITGRATRGYVAYDPGSDKLVFVKDSWRSTDPAMTKETDILRTINSAGITEGVPVLLCGDDLEGLWQSTLTAEYSREKWNLGRERDVSRRIHTRFAMDKVGKPMENFKASKDFLKVVYDAFRAHEAVYNKCKILHCDISAANILVTVDGKGFLSDWDLARTIEAIESGPHRDFRTGTWRFMSSTLLAAPAKFHTVQDDIEFFFWVTVHTSMCFLPNSWTSHIKAVMNYIFDEATVGLHPTAPIGGTGKLCNVSSFQPLSIPLKIRDNRPLSEFVERGRRLVNSLYIEEGEVRRNILYETTERDREREIYFAFQKKLDSIPLCDHALFEPLFIDALDTDDWPVNDPAHDYFQEAVQRSAEKRKAEEMQDYLEALEEGTREKKSYKALVQLSGNQEVAKAKDPPTAVHSERRRSARIVALSSKPSTKAIHGKSIPPTNCR